MFVADPTVKCLAVQMPTAINNFPDIATLAQDFPRAREYIDACLDPTSAPVHLQDHLIADPHKLKALLRAMEKHLPEIARPPFPPFIPPRPPKKIKGKQQKKLLEEWNKRNLKFQDEYQQKWQAFYQKHGALFAEHEAVSFKRKVIERLGRDLASKTLNGTILAPGRLNWIILHPGSDHLSQLRQHCAAYAQRHPHKQVEFSRIEQVHALRPTATYIGNNEFDGYLVFYFATPRLAVLENPIVGNAIYLIGGDWVALSRLTKSDLLCHHSNRVRRIIHTDGWLWELKRHLTMREPTTTQQEFDFLSQ